MKEKDKYYVDNIDTHIKIIDRKLNFIPFTILLMKWQRNTGETLHPLSRQPKWRSGLLF